jgi:hypothetical protein
MRAIVTATRLPPLPRHLVRAALFYLRVLVSLIFALLFVSRITLRPSFAQEDLLRDVATYAWQLDCGRLCPAPRLPDFDPGFGLTIRWACDREGSVLVAKLDDVILQVPADL